MQEKSKIKEVDTLYISAPVNALVDGIYRENRRLEQIKEQGDFGLGTFNDLDGEMVLLGGTAYQITSTGQVNRPGDDVRTPFACVTFFREMTYDEPKGGVSSFEELMNLVQGILPSPNMMYALWIDGDFEYVRTRSVPRQEHYRPLVEVTRDQPVFDIKGVSGTMAGFYTPDFMASLNVPGVHLHFMSQDRTFGGHLLECRAVRLRIGVQILRRLKMDLPASLEYMTA
ncbi:MAG: acetolactate decarboxylase, partial [Desulfonatronovibrio sp.]